MTLDMIGMVDRTWMHPQMEEGADWQEESVWPEEDTDGIENRASAFEKVRYALNSIKYAVDLMDDAVNSGVDKPMRSRIASYHDELSDLLDNLQVDFEGWQRL